MGDGNDFISDPFKTGIKNPLDSIGIDLGIPSASELGQKLGVLPTYEQQETGSMDYSQWEAWERAYVAAHPSLVSAYDTGKIKWSPEEIFYGEGKINAWSKAGGTIYESEYAKWVEDWKANQLAANYALIEAGVPAYTLDPTPWDDLTVEDLAEQELLKQEYDVKYLAEQEALAAAEAAEAAAEAEALAQAQMEYDLEQIDQLAEYRMQSETLATTDVNQYVAELTEQYKLRGVTPGFTEDIVESLVNERFTEYWSQENEETLMGLLDTYISTGVDLPTISPRTWSSGGVTITNPTVRDTLGSNVGVQIGETTTFLGGGNATAKVVEEEEEEPVSAPILSGSKFPKTLLV
jgi:hypothetical protein